MAHVRKQIRAAVIAHLAGTTSAGARVSGTQTILPEPGDCPCLDVRTTEEVATVALLAGTLERRIAVDVVAMVVSIDADDALDALAAEVEQRLDSLEMPTLGVHDFVYESAMLDIETGGPGQVAALRMRYVATALSDGPETPHSLID